MNFIKQLSSFGLTENQANIYVSLLGLKKATVLQIARKTGLQRPTIYDNISRLQDIGLVTKILERGKPMFIPEDPQSIHSYLSKQQKEASVLIPELQSLFGQESVKQDIKFFRGAEGLKRLTDVILQSKEKEIRTIGNYQENIRGMFSKRFLEELWHARTRRNTKARILFSYAAVEPLKKERAYSEIGNIRYNREVRILPEAINLHVLYTIVDDNVLFWSNQKEGYSFLFKSNSYADSLKTLFDFLWSVSVPLKLT